MTTHDTHETQAGGSVDPATDEKRDVPAWAVTDSSKATTGPSTDSDLPDYDSVSYADRDPDGPDETIALDETASGPSATVHNDDIDQVNRGNRVDDVDDVDATGGPADPVIAATPVTATGTGDSTGADTGDSYVHDADQVHDRWRDVQVAFVDDPHQAVEQARDLVGQVVEQVVSGVNSHVDRVGESWSGSDSDTEKMRVALHDYRDLLDRLLAV